MARKRAQIRHALIISALTQQLENKMITYQDAGGTVTVKPSALNLPMIERRIKRLLPSSPPPEALLLVAVIARHIHENVMYTSEMPPERLDRACEMMMDGWAHTRCPQFCDLLGIDGVALVEEFQAVMKRIHSPE